MKKLSLIIFVCSTLTSLLCVKVSFASEQGMVLKVRVASFTGGMEAYEQGLVKLAGQKTIKKYGPFTVEPIPKKYSTQRFLSLIREGKDVHAMITSLDLPQSQLKGIIKLKLPLLENSLGLRANIVRTDFLKQFTGTKSFSELKKFKVGQALGWPDSVVYESYDFPLIQASRETNLFGMLHAGRFDFLPLNFLKISPGLEQISKKFKSSLSVSNTYIYYPINVWMYVSGGGSKVSNRLQEGLKTAFSDGSAKKLFFDLYKNDIKKLHSEGSAVYVLNNPSFSQTTNTELINQFIENFNLKGKVIYPIEK